MKARKGRNKSTLKKPTSGRKLANKATRGRISKNAQKKFRKKRNIRPLTIKMNKIKSKLNNGTNELSDGHPSTSRQALALSSDTAVSSTRECLRSRKTFQKFKDVKQTNGHNKKHNPHRERKILQESSHLPILSAPSRSQLLSKKILRTIRKRKMPLGLHRPNKSPTMTASDQIHKDFKICIPNSVPVETKIVSDDMDDDCVCIEPQPEIILIDDETLTTSTEVEKLEADSCGETNFKPYEPIVSMRLNIPCSLNAVTSTPKTRLLSGNMYGDTTPSHGRMSSSISMIQDCTLVAKTNVNTEVVVIDDTVIQSDFVVTGRNRRRHDTDDSVVFVSENVNTRTCQPSRALEFIPLDTPVEESQFRVKWATSTPIPKSTPQAKRARNDLFNTKEQKQLRQYNENAYNPNGDDPALLTKKRMVIVDGSNVAYQHALNKEFSVKGLKICLDYFEKMGHDVKAVVPQFRLQKQRSTDSSGLEKLHQDGKIVFTPCKNLPGKSSISYDDRFVLQLAAELDAAIVSNDNYRDLIHENPAFKKIIENRVIGYTWCNDLFILPKDPYGKWGPTLSTILNRT